MNSTQDCKQNIVLNDEQWPVAKLHLYDWNHLSNLHVAKAKATEFIIGNLLAVLSHYSK